MKILSPQLRVAEFTRTVYAATPDHGTSVEDLCSPETWAHVAKQFRAGDRIEVVPVSGGWFAELYVRKVDEHGVHVTVLRQHNLTDDTVVGKPSTAKSTAAKPTPPGKEADDTFKSDLYDVKFGGADKWRVLRKSDKAVMAKHLNSREEGEAWVKENETALV